MEKNITRGIRNNNPGNIRKSNDPWQGLSEEQNDTEFFKFKSMAFGIRAIARTLITWQDRDGIKTIETLVPKYAPATENDVVAYIKRVSTEANIHSKVKLNFHNYEDLEPIIRGIIRMENGATWKTYISLADIDAGLTLAGVTPNKSLFNSRHIRATAVAAGAGVSIAYQAFNESVQHISPVLPLIQRVSQYWPILASCVLFGALGYIVYSRIRDRKRGL